MLVGAISDTHDNMDQVEKAERVFRDHDVKAIIHCGDFITPLVYDQLATLNVPFYGVFGNNDYEEALRAHSHSQIKKEPYRFSLGGRAFYICHESRLAGEDQIPHGIDIVVYGQTHKVEVRKTGTMLMLNPGESCGWVYGRSTVALIDSETLNVEIVELPL